MSAGPSAGATSFERTEPGLGTSRAGHVPQERGRGDPGSAPRTRRRAGAHDPLGVLQNMSLLTSYKQLFLRALQTLEPLLLISCGSASIRCVLTECAHAPFMKRWIRQSATTKAPRNRERRDEANTGEQDTGAAAHDMASYLPCAIALSGCAENSCR